MKTEPELTAEIEGWVGQTWVTGIGDIPCWLSQHVEVEHIFVKDEDGDEYEVPIDGYDTNGDSIIKLSELVCHNIRLLPVTTIDTDNDGVDDFLHYIPACNKIYVVIEFLLQDVDEDLILTFGGVDNDGDGQIDEDGRGCAGDTPGVDDDGDGFIDEDPALDGNDPAGTDGGYFDGNDADIKLKCWDKWPTNAYQKDKMLWDMLFSLVQYDP
jgi:hypothetical protein